MVLTVFWVPSWTIPTISVSVLCVAAVFLLCCICITKKRTDDFKIGIPTHRNVINISTNSINRLFTFRYFNSGNKELSPSAVPVCSQDSSDSELVDSTSINGMFDSSRLKIDGMESCEALEDVKSCDSADSRFTFYSTYPAFVRTDSNSSDAATYKSTRTSTRKSHYNSCISVA